jgi:teichuronic acid biosynthesis glycosyltransferase TuaC
MAAANLFVLPSYSEGMPTVLVEAAAARLPVASTPVGGIPQLLGSDRGLLFPPRSPTAVAGAIAAVLDDPAGARARAARLLAFVREEYDVDHNARSLVGLYEELSEGRAAGRKNVPAGAA